MSELLHSPAEVFHRGENTASFDRIWDLLAADKEPHTKNSDYTEGAALVSSARYILVNSERPNMFMDMLDASIDRLSTLSLESAIGHQSLILDLLDVSNTLKPFTPEEETHIAEKIRSAVLSNPPLGENYESVRDAIDRVFQGDEETDFVSGVHLKDNKGAFRDESVHAREAAVIAIGLNSKTTSILFNAQPHLLPRGRIIGNYFLFEQIGLDPVKVVSGLPLSMSYAPESVREKVENLKSLGLDPVRVIHELPSSLSYAPESVRIKVENLRMLGLDPAKVINAEPNNLRYAPETLRERFENLKSLGLDPVRVIHGKPTALGYAVEGVRDKVENLKSLGLDPVKVIHRLPAIIGLTPESIREKVESLRMLGLDPIKVINRQPATLGLSPESICKKVRLITNIARKLQWQGADNYQQKEKFPVTELIESMPSLLGTSRKKIRTIFTIFTMLDENSRNTSLNDVVSASPLPLELLILSYNSLKREQQHVITFGELIKTARSMSRNMSKEMRREQTLFVVDRESTDPVNSRYLKQFPKSQ